MIVHLDLHLSLGIRNEFTVCRVVLEGLASDFEAVIIARRRRMSTLSNLRMGGVELNLPVSTV